MADAMLGTLQRADPREIWPNEATDFTPWLADHLPKLGEVLDMQLELQQREAPAGNFSLDLLARDLSRNKVVVIENQLSGTNHDHLGKLMTYAAAYDAAAAVWIAPAIRDEHRQALDWLNQHTDLEVGFFGVIVELLRVDDSKPALNFRPVAMPNQWRKAHVGGPSGGGDSTGKGEAYCAWFQALIDELRENHSFTGARAGQPQSWYLFASGISGVWYGTSFALGGRVRAEIYIDTGDSDENKRVFDALQEVKEAVETEAGEGLEWERLDEKRACRIAFYRPGSIDESQESLKEMRGWAIQKLLRLKEVFQQRTQRILGEA